MFFLMMAVEAVVAAYRQPPNLRYNLSDFLCSWALGALQQVFELLCGWAPPLLDFCPPPTPECRCSLRCSPLFRTRPPREAPP